MSTGSVVVVIGASSGIGRETALAYARRRANLVLVSRSQDALSRVAEECASAGATYVLVQPTDIADADQVHALFAAAVGTYGRVDIVAHCAAITAFGRFEDLPVDVFDAIIRTNLLGAVNVARAALAQFQQRGTGHLVIVGSLLGVTAVPFQSAYVMSKFALSGLVRALRQENRHRRGIRIHGLYPGPVDTDVYLAAGNFLGRAPRVAPTADAPATIARAIVTATTRRRSTERQIGWVNRPAIAAYRLLPSLFDAFIIPLLHATSFGPEPTEKSAGNVHGSGGARSAAQDVRLRK
ncbi:SDR family oxidoreductase [Mycolicibacterium bacteremicum]|uniref:SDR family NAD(P)-dependent oxidoreductase n=1 Tax=Mycolicibacterium bacteremicum TaxID=564198 RepID=UPI0026F28D7F|nr:SDR family NAD(P)-dependent oxidoreductase [Mycolicibacterium bacteremicum]